MLLLVLCLIVGMAQLSRKMYETMEAEDEADDTMYAPQLGKLDLSAPKHG